MTLLLVPFIASLMALASAGNFKNDMAITFGQDRVKFLNGGRDLTLSLDNNSGSGFRSKNEVSGRCWTHLHPLNDMLTSQGSGHDEIDFEFLGNVSGQPYTVHTNVFAQGKGDREQQFHICFDPTTDSHTYSIVWNPDCIIFLIDNIPVRVYNNHEAKGVPFPKNQPMKVYSSQWEAYDWATQGARVKTNWTNAPFVACYRNININANCVASPSAPCEPKSKDLFRTAKWETQGLDGAGRNRIRWVHQKFMIYNYCANLKRFPKGLPDECKLPRF